MRRAASVALVLAAFASSVAFPPRAWLPVGTAGAATQVAVPASIDASGRRDVTAELTSFFAGLRPGTTVTFPAGGRFRCEGIVLVAGATDLTIEGNGATIFATTDGRGAAPPRRGFGSQWPRRREHLEFRQVSGLRVHDLTVRGANPHAGAQPGAYIAALEGQAGIALVRSRDVVLDDVTVTRTYGDLIYVAGGSTNVTVTRSHLTDSGRQGVAIVGATNVRVTGTRLDGIARSVFDLEPPGRGVASGVRLDGNDIGDYVNFLLAAVGGGAGVGQVRLEGNRVTGSRGIAVVAGVDRIARRDFQIVGNRGTARARPLAAFGSGAILQLTNLDGVVLRDNEQPVAGVTAVSLDRVCHLTATGNRFPGATHDQQVVAPCGAPAGPGPTRPNRGTRAGRVGARASTTTLAPAPVAAAGGESGGSSTDTAAVLLAGGAGVLVGLGIAAAIWWLVRRRTRLRTGT